MITYERQKEILNLLRTKDSLTVQSLCAKLYASPATVRRDLAQMEREGLIIRVRGGAALRDTRSRDTPFLLRSSINLEKKEAIAQLVLPLIRGCSCVMMDSSTTTAAVARLLSGFHDLTVITNGLPAIAALNEYSDARVICTGGAVKNNSSLLGEAAAETVSRYCADAFLFSCRGVDAQQGVTDADEEVAALKRRMMSRAKLKILLCDSTKFSASFLCRVCSLSEIDVLVSNAPAPEALSSGFRGRLVYPGCSQ